MGLFVYKRSREIANPSIPETVQTFCEELYSKSTLDYPADTICKLSDSGLVYILVIFLGTVGSHTFHRLGPIQSVHEQRLVTGREVACFPFSFRSQRERLLISLSDYSLLYTLSAVQEKLALKRLKLGRHSEPLCGGRTGAGEKSCSAHETTYSHFGYDLKHIYHSYTSLFYKVCNS